MMSRDGTEAAWATYPTVTADVSDVVAETASASSGAGAMVEPPVNLPVDLPTMLREIENAYINAALTQTRSNKKEAAKLLGMGRTTLVEKLRRRNTAAARAA
jgi:sigma-54 specific flagellar transcriptional regulator A